MKTAKTGWLFKLLTKVLPYKTIATGGSPYLTRFYLLGTDRDYVKNGAKLNVFLHFFHRGDADRELHNHPWTGTSLILTGGYTEERMTHYQYWCGPTEAVDSYSKVKTRIFRPGSVNRIGLKDFHRATLLDDSRGCWTLFFAGERVRDWGFLDPKTWRFTHWRSKPDAVP